MCEGLVCGCLSLWSLVSAILLWTDRGSVMVFMGKLLCFGGPSLLATYATESSFCKALCFCGHSLNLVKVLRRLYVADEMTQQ